MTRTPKRAESTPVKAWLTIEGWHGSTATEVALVGMTKHRFRIRALRPTRLSGRGRVLDTGHEALVPKTAVRQGRSGGLFAPGELPDKVSSKASPGPPSSRRPGFDCCDGCDAPGCDGAARVGSLRPGECGSCYAMGQPCGDHRGRPGPPRCTACWDELGPEDEDDEEGRCAGCALAALENDPNYCGECNASPCSCDAGR
jgi:hypothetical protein